jgi:Ca2+-binding EF-hand superfamily protein
MQRVLQALCMLVVGFGLCHAMSSIANAADSQPSAKATDLGLLFDQLDTQHKGVLSASQIPEEKRSLFERLLRLAGKPVDGELTRAEFVAQLKSITEPPPSVLSESGNQGGSSGKSASNNSDQTGKKPESNGQRPQIDPAKLFDRWDTDHKGKLTANDVPQRAQQLFKRLLKISGKPASGALTKAQFVDAADKFLARRAGSNGAGTNSPPSGQNRPGANLGQNFDVDKLVARIMQRSTRSDGQLTKGELPERLQNHFDKIDQNRDGLVSEAELRAWLNKVKQRQAAKNGTSASNPQSNGSSSQNTGSTAP